MRYARALFDLQIFIALVLHSPFEIKNRDNLGVHLDSAMESSYLVLLRAAGMLLHDLGI